ncbi:MAG: hypothetical protein VB027_06070 [Gordonibacter sp.]|nr:hypothetical protein [Gordonibacter sp.]
MKALAKQTVFSICVFFTLAMIICLALGYLFAGPSYGLNLTLSLLTITIGIGILQALWFSGAIVKKLAYPLRIACFGATALPVIASSAKIGAWLPDDQPETWGTFVLIFLVTLAAMTAAYTIYYHKTAGSYEQALTRYRNRQGK